MPSRLDIEKLKEDAKQRHSKKATHKKLLCIKLGKRKKRHSKKVIQKKPLYGIFKPRKAYTYKLDRKTVSEKKVYIWKIIKAKRVISTIL